ncbi:MAG TPA: gamma-glutamyltransferase [Ilumatobacteraceae bacterium]|nr:gamma-glutamyltransferase [Ilumatobacteraceae bacterium]
MPGFAPPVGSTRGASAMVATADQIATQAGMVAFHRGGNAVDAAIAANAAIAVTSPHLCGLGGDLFVLVHTGRSVAALNSSGRSGSGADPAAMRAAGNSEMPFRHDIRSVTLPGCVDGWISLHERFGSIPLADVLEPAIRVAEHGFPASPLLVASLATIDDAARANLHEVASQATHVGALVHRYGVARTLRAVAANGRNGFYGGEFAAGLLALGRGYFVAADLERSQADWVTPLAADAFGVRLHTIPPNSQGYLTLGAARLANQVGLPDDPDDPQWAHLLIEAATAAGFDRPAVLHERADGAALLAAIEARSNLIDPQRAGRRPTPARAGDTTYLCTADAHGMGVSLIQSNAAGFGSWLVEPNTGINLHNRGMGFALEPGHVAEFGPRRRPPHTLSPALATRGGDLAAVFGTMGGDAQPQILLQLAARMFRHGQSPAAAVHAGRWALQGPQSGFDTWTGPGGPAVSVEGQAPDAWRIGLAQRGHVVQQGPAYDSGYGHAHAIVIDPSGMLVGAADPRARVSAVAAI